MTLFQHIYNEKSVVLSKNNTYIFSTDNPAIELTKHDVIKLLKQNKFDALAVRTLRPPTKVKTRNTRKGSTKKSIKRAKKYYVTLKEGQKIEENFAITI